MDLKALRNKIDEIDEQLMKLLNERFEVTTKIGQEKMINHLHRNNSIREDEILQRTIPFKHSRCIKKVYQDLFKISKHYQAFDYFLLGKSLPYSYSPEIYNLLGLDNYMLFATDDPKRVLVSRNFKGCNVTNPYKEVAYQVCDSWDSSAKVTGVVNTIINNNGKLTGYNTDYQALIDMFKSYHIDLNNKFILIIGNGSTSKSVRQAILALTHNCTIKNIVRTKRNEEEKLLHNYQQVKKAHIIINTTPYATSPACETEPLFPLDSFIDLEVAIEVIYNPFRTPLLSEAAKYGAKTINGLYMLCRQALHSYQLYQHQNKMASFDEILYGIKKKTINIALIGMPYAGKSYLGKIIASRLEMNYIDTDDELKHAEHSLEALLQSGKTIEDYRRFEEKVVLQCSQYHGYVISTGGGVITREANFVALNRNSIIIYLKTPLDVLLSRVDQSRPLIKDKQNLIDLYNERSLIYEKWADLIIDTSLEEEKIIKTIEDKLHENFSN